MADRFGDLSPCTLVWLVWLGSAWTAACAQESKAPPPTLIDTAPASAQSPAAWYPPDSDITYTEAGIRDHPYTAILVTESSFINPKTGEHREFAVKTFQGRDAQGRHREEVERPRPNGKGEAIVTHEVTVYDPVSHCDFQWMEPWVVADPAYQQPVATVICKSRVLHYTKQNIWRDKVTTEHRDTRSKLSDEVQEPLGSRVMEGVDVVGSRFTKTRLDPDGNVKSSVITELWYSPELDVLISMTFAPSANAGMGPTLASYHLTAIQRVAPNPKLFYPPAGYKIEPAYPYRR